MVFPNEFLLILRPLTCFLYYIVAVFTITRCFTISSFWLLPALSVPLSPSLFLSFSSVSVLIGLHFRPVLFVMIHTLAFVNGHHVLRPIVLQMLTTQSYNTVSYEYTMYLLVLWLCQCFRLLLLLKLLLLTSLCSLLLWKGHRVTLTCLGYADRHWFVFLANEEAGDNTWTRPTS